MPRACATRAAIVRFSPARRYVASMSEPAVPAAGAGVKGETKVIEPSPRQRTIARRVAEARATVPHFECSAEVQLRAAAALPATASAVLVRACALALRAHPRANGAYRDGRFELYSRINVAVTLETDEAFVTPVLFDADGKSLAHLDAELQRIAQRARAGVLASPELSGATFTICDLSLFATVSAAAIPFPSQAAVLTAGAIRDTAVVRDGVVCPGRAMTITLTCDGRILYPAQAASFLQAVTERIAEMPGER